MRQSRLIVGAWIIAAIVMLIVVASVATAVWYFDRARHENVMVIVMIDALSPANFGTVQMRYKFELKGSE